MANIKLKKLLKENIGLWGIASRPAIGGVVGMRPRTVTKEIEEPQEDELNTLVKDPTENLTKDHKRKFLESVRKFNKFGKSIYREHNLKEVTKNIYTLGRLAEKITLSETDDWFDKRTVEKDMKGLAEAVKMFEGTAKEMSVLQQRLESVYEEIGHKLGKYFEIADPEVDGDEIIEK